MVGGTVLVVVVDVDVLVVVLVVVVDVLVVVVVVAPVLTFSTTTEPLAALSFGRRRLLEHEVLGELVVGLVHGRGAQPRRGDGSLSRPDRLAHDGGDHDLGLRVVASLRRGPDDQARDDESDDHERAHDPRRLVRLLGFGGGGGR